MQALKEQLARGVGSRYTVVHGTALHFIPFLCSEASV